MIMVVSDILKKLGRTTKRNEKIALLESLDVHEQYLFKRVAYLTYQPTINYWVKEVEWPREEDNNLFSDTTKPKISLDEALDVLQYDIAGRKFTGNAAHDKIIETYHNMVEEDKMILQRILEGDLRVGVSVKTLNKVWPDLVYDHPYMRGSSFNKKNLSNIRFPCFSQTKEDGEYEDIIIADTIEIRSRNGAINNRYLSHSLHSAIDNYVDSDIVLMGEVLVFEDTTREKLMPRQKGNGYLNSNNVDPERLFHVIWDVVPYEDFLKGVCKTPYKDRFSMLKRIVSNLRLDTDQIKIIDSREVNSVDEIVDHFMKNVEDGLEGVMVKNMDMAWKDGTSKDQVKVKVEFECELKIVGFNQGKTLGEWDEKVGSIIYQSADEKLEVHVGTGLSDEERVEIWNNRLSYMKKISTIKSNDVIASELKPDKMSLFLPRVTKLVRSDKNKADTYDRIIEQKEAFVNTLKAVEENK